MVMDVMDFSHTPTKRNLKSQSLEFHYQCYFGKTLSGPVTQKFLEKES